MFVYVTEFVLSQVKREYISDVQPVRPFRTAEGPQQSLRPRMKDERKGTNAKEISFSGVPDSTMDLGKYPTFFLLFVFPPFPGKGLLSGRKFVGRFLRVYYEEVYVTDLK